MKPNERLPLFRRPKQGAYEDARHTLLVGLPAALVLVLILPFIFQGNP